MEATRKEHIEYLLTRLEKLNGDDLNTEKIAKITKQIKRKIALA